MAQTGKLTLVRGILLILFCLIYGRIGQAGESVDPDPCRNPLSALAEMDPEDRIVSRVAAAAQNLSQAKNPFLQAGFDSNSVGRVHLKLGVAYPPYVRIRQLCEAKELTADEWAEAQTLGSLLAADMAKPNPSLDETSTFLELATLFPSLQAKRPFERATTHHIEDTRTPEKSKDEGQDAGDDETPQKPQPWNRPPKEYSAHNKRLKQDQKTAAVELLRTDAVSGTSFFRQITYDTIAPHRVIANPEAREVPTLDLRAVSMKRLTVSFHGAPEVALPLPQGYDLSPTQPSQLKMRRDREGITWVTNAHQANSADIHLAPIIGHTKPPRLDLYSTPSGIDPESWPEAVRTHLKMIEATGNRDPHWLNQEISQYLKFSGGFRFYSESEAVTKKDLDSADALMASLTGPEVVKMAYAKLFNCDGAAVTPAIWLRDFFSVPTRLVAGRTLSGQTVEGTQLVDVVTSAGPPHMWYEFWDGQTWVPGDAQPPHRPASEPTSQSKDRLSQRDPSDPPTKPTPTATPSEPKETETEAPKPKSTAPEVSPDKEEKRPNPGEEDNLTIDLTQAYNPFYSLIDAILKIEHVEQSIASGLLQANTQLHSLLEKIDGDFAPTLRTQLGSFADSFQTAANGNLQSLALRLSSIRALDLEQKPEPLWQELKGIEKLLVSLGQLRRLAPEEAALLGQVQQLMAGLRTTLASPESQQILFIEQLLSTLPGNISHGLIEQMVGRPLSGRGSEGFSLFSQKASSPEFAYFRQLARVAPLVNLILNRTKEPIYRNHPTDERSPVPTRRQDVVVATRPDQFSRFIWNPIPGEDLFAPFARGEQFMVGSLETRKVIDPQLPLERKFTTVLVDVSESMEHRSRAKAAQLIVSAIVDAALSEKDDLGVPLHEVLVVFFNERVLKELNIPINDRTSAMNALAGFRDMPQGRAKGTTQIEPAVEAFYDYLAACAENRRGTAAELRRVKRANLVVVSDGGAPFSFEKLQAKRDALPEDIGIFMNFLALGGENEGLKKLAENSNQANASGMYKRYSDDELDGFFAEPPVVPSDDQRLVIAGWALQPTESNLIQGIIHSPPFPRNTQTAVELSALAQPVASREANATTLNFHKFVYWLIAQKQFPKPTRVRLWNQLVAQYPTISQIPLHQMGELERQLFAALRNWVDAHD